jgi:hypothetical protein
VRHETHPGTESLQAYAETSLPTGDAVTVESHLLTCPRCATEVEEWRALFMALSALPQLAPSPGFVDRVLMKVRTPKPAPQYALVFQRAGELFTRLTPRTASGWALVAAFVALPLFTGGAALTWLFARGYLTPAMIWAFLNDRAAGGVQSIGSSVLTALMRSDAMLWLANATQQVLSNSGAVGLGALAGAAALVTTLSIWILYRNLFRTPTRESKYVTYSF